MCVLLFTLYCIILYYTMLYYSCLKGVMSYTEVEKKLYSFPVLFPVICNSLFAFLIVAGH